MVCKNIFGAAHGNAKMICLLFFTKSKRKQSKKQRCLAKTSFCKAKKKDALQKCLFAQYFVLRTAVQKCLFALPCAATRPFDEQKFIFARQMFSKASGSHILLLRPLGLCKGLQNECMPYFVKKSALRFIDENLKLKEGIHFCKVKIL